MMKNYDRFFSNCVEEAGPRLACLGHGFTGSHQLIIRIGKKDDG
jgi:hypothetical protein